MRSIALHAVCGIQAEAVLKLPGKSVRAAVLRPACIAIITDGQPYGVLKL